MSIMSVQDPILFDVATEVDGYWRLMARSRRGRWRDITKFRGIPTELGTMSFADPFGPRDFTFSVPNVTLFDSLGTDDLDWVDEEMRVRLEWALPINPLPPDYGYGYGIYDPVDDLLADFKAAQSRFNGWIPGFDWRGNVSSRRRDSDGLALTCKGAVFQLDDYLAQPEYPRRPLPYEIAIARQFRNKPHMRIGHLKVAWPSWWRKTYTPPGKKTPDYLVPAGIHKGQYWTGMLTRETGHWDPALTSYIQGMLSAMYTSRGRFTIDLLKDGPVLMHREMYNIPPAHTVVIDPTAPGFDITADEDFSQSLGVIFASGVSLDGVTYSGMEVSASNHTYYSPAATRRELDPVTDNDWLDRSRTRREVMLQMQRGLDRSDAELVAREHLRRFGDPGVTGTVTIKADPFINGQRINKMLVRAGMPIQVPGLFGRPEGLLAHITENTVNWAEDSNVLTYDSKFRDALTVREVRLRGRDALQIPRMLVAGQYNPPIPDQLVPWDYSKGSGYLPSGKHFSSVPLFDGMPDDLPFPWESWTRQRPPKRARWADSYMRVAPASSNANNNWGYVGGGGLAGRLAFPIRAAQMATIRLIELAAYDQDGNVLPVSFHFSLYYVSGTSVLSMPRIPARENLKYGVFRAGQHYPFGKDAWERYKVSGELQDPNIPQPATTNGFIRAYGTFYDKAGYFPGSYHRGDAPTGLLRDETQFSIDTTQMKQAFDPYDKHRNSVNPYAGMIYAMIYCDEQGNQPVYFAGRMFRVEPGQNEAI